MFAVLTQARKTLRPIAALATVFFLSACGATILPGLGGGNANSGGPQIDPAAPLKVALLVPKTDNLGAGPVAASLENAARLAVSEQQGVQIDLRVYDTGGNAAAAAAQAQLAVDEGAQIIIGPLRADAVNAAGLAVADEGINVLGFSNNAKIAGGNVFVLGQLFNNTADRLLKYAKANGKTRPVIMHLNDANGQIARFAVEQAAAANGLSVVSSEAYALEEASIAARAQAVAGIVNAGAADIVFITVLDVRGGELPFVLDQLKAQGIPQGNVQIIGLTRWDVRPELYDRYAGAWFAIPDQSRDDSFSGRYSQAFGDAPHPLAGLAYDGIAAVAALAGAGRSDAVSGRALTSTGFVGSSGLFRLLSNGQNERGLAVATVRDGKVVTLDPAPRSLSGAGL